MIPELRGYELIFRTSDSLFLRALDGMTDEGARRKPAATKSVAAAKPAESADAAAGAATAS